MAKQASRHLVSILEPVAVGRCWVLDRSAGDMHHSAKTLDFRALGRKWRCVRWAAQVIGKGRVWGVGVIMNGGDGARCGTGRVHGARSCSTNKVGSTPAGRKGCRRVMLVRFLQ